jgi:DNA-binding NarL/FixJ family response regulator
MPLRKLNDNVKVVMLSSQQASWIILQTISRGATEYVVKDESAFEKILSFCRTGAHT